MRVRTVFLGPALLTFLVFAPARAGADTITVTSGYLDWTSTTGVGTLVLNGTGGFAFDSIVSTIGGVLTPANRCNGGLDCTAGSTVSLYAHWIGNDLDGSALYNGQSFDDVGGFNSPSQMSVSFTGSFLVPAGSGNLSTTAPFMFSGTFIHPAGNTIDHTPMNGTGTAFIALSPYSYDPSAFRVTHLRYEFGSQPGVPTPEPASMLLLGTGLVGAIVARRRHAKP